jgi:putative DNA primase/helicase
MEIAAWQAAEPIELARAFAADAKAMHFARWRSEWWRYDSGRYQTVADDELAVIARRFLGSLVVVSQTEDGKEKRARYRTSRHKVGELAKALEAHQGVMLGRNLDAPLWRERGTSAPDLLVCANGVLDIETRTLRPLSPDLFATSAVSYAYDAAAPPPARWDAFLRQLWPDDEESRHALEELLGLLLTGETRYQKIWLFLGPRRSGKGTIFRILRMLIGASACVSPTLSSMSNNFGMASWMHARVATISDARLSGRTDQAIVVERLLRVSGEDPFEIDRKFLSPVTIEKLQTRILIATNELPRFVDASGALASRLVLFRLTESFLGRENHRLEEELLEELPGILNRALDGLARLRKRGRLLQPASGNDALGELEELTAPVSAFVRSELVIDPRNAELWIETAEVYRRFRSWCEERGWATPPRSEVFGRDLAAAFPDVKRKRRRVGTVVAWVYFGIGVQEGDQ